MANTYVKIASNTVTTNTNAINFTSIPSTYTDLQVNISGVLDTTNSTYRFRLNSNTSAVYSNTRIYGNGATAASDHLITNGTLFGDYVFVTDGNYTTKTSLYISNYSGSNFKQIIIDNGWQGNATTAHSQLMSALWRSTAVVNEVNIFTGAGNFTAGTIATLYGIKNTA